MTDSKSTPPASAPDFSAGSCTKGCFAFRTTAALRRLTNSQWTIAPDGKSYRSTLGELASGAWMDQMQKTLSTMDGLTAPASELVWREKNKDGSYTLHINRKAAEMTQEVPTKPVAEGEVAAAAKLETFTDRLASQATGPSAGNDSARFPAAGGFGGSGYVR